MTHLYALLVGINQYDKRSFVPSLNGCTNDVKAIQAYLEARTPDKQLHLRTLIDRQATRQAIIDGFRQHLQQAQADDTVLFYYAGHGSQDLAPPAFWTFEPDRLNETLVCYDSRTEGVRDLADKELAKLIHEVSQSNPHIAIVLDCCHSGSGTRGDIVPAVVERQVPIDKRDRPLESFIVSLEELEKIENQQLRADGATRSLDDSTNSWQLQGRHVLMSACRDQQLAREYYDNDGSPHGAFSYFLLNALTKSNRSLTYRDLFSSVYAKMRSQISDQSPQLEASDLEDLNRPFLGGAVTAFEPYFTLSWDRDRHWSINGGAVHGLPLPEGEQTTKLALFPFDSSPADRQHLDRAVASATVVEVLPQFSYVQVEDSLDPTATYKAVVTDLPLPPLGIVLEGEACLIGRVRQALQKAGASLLSPRYVEEVTDVSFAKFRVIAKAGEYAIARPTDARSLIAPIPDTTAASAEQLLQKLDHMARWTTLCELDNPAASSLSADAVKVELYRDNKLITAEQLQLSYQQRGGQWQPPQFKARLINTTHRHLYCTLLNLTEDYSISAPFFGSGGIWVDAKEEAWATVVVGDRLSDLISTNVPDALWQQGVTEYLDILKLIVSTAEFDPTLLIQNKLNEPPVSPRRNLNALPRSTLSRLMLRAGTRDIGAARTVETVDDWMTYQIAITTMRPQTTETISADRAISVSDQITVQPHPYLRASATLMATPASRSVGAKFPPPLTEVTQPLSLSVPRDTEPSLDVLELSDIRGADTVTAKSPLVVSVNAPLGPNETLLPVAWDGEFFFPLGYGQNKGKQTEVVLQQLPQFNQTGGPQAPNTRSIGGAIRIFFRKVVTQTLGETLSQKLGISFEYPILAAIDSTHNETATYLTDSDEIAARVDRAKNIVVYVHGIVGDTQAMVPSIRTAHAKIAGQTRQLDEVYDLVLTYDYESLNTSIATNAAQLKQRLAAVGIVPGHRKTVHVVAHSMGGLISRWLIEKEKGSELIQHLIMLGTPNAGSPWPVVQAGLTKALCFAINGLSSAAWPVALVGSTLSAIEALDVSLDEMEPGSALLGQLAASEPPIPYSIVAGNTDLLPIDEKTTLREKLEQKLSKLVALPFLQTSNDIAVSVSSISHVPAGGEHRPQIREVACNHLVYFTDPAGLAGLGWAVGRAFGMT